MSWKDNFPERILDRGYELYDKGCVKGLTMNRAATIARVKDRWTHAVRVTFLSEDGTELLGSCDCTSSKSGYYCEHMAAVLFGRDALTGEAETDEPGADPDESDSGTVSAEEADAALEVFERETGGEELYFHLPDIIRSVEYDEEELYDAWQLVRRNEVKLLEKRFGYGLARGISDYMGAVTGVIQTGKKERIVRCFFSRTEVLSAECDLCGRRMNGAGYYYSFWYDRDVCSHILALLILVAEYIRKYNPGDETDWSSARFLKSFRSYRLGRELDEDAKSHSVHLLPEVYETGGAAFLRFKISDGGRFYMIKDLALFVKQVSEGQQMEAGKNCCIDFARKAMAEDSAIWYRLIEEQVRNADVLQETYTASRDYFSENLRIKDRIPLTGEALDDFYDEMLGKTVPVTKKPRTGRQEKGILQITDEPYILELTLTPLLDEWKAEPYAVSLEGTLPAVVRGRSAEYIFRDGSLTRLSREASSAISLFSEEFSRSINLKIGKKRLSEFIYRVLPSIEDNPAVRVEWSGEEEIRSILPPEAEYCFYLDLDEGKFLCRPEVRYGDDVYELRDLKEEDFPLPACRDPLSESEILTEIKNYFSSYDEADGAYVSENDADSAYRILSTGVGELMRLGEVHGTDAFFRARIRRSPSVRVGVSLESGIMTLDIATEDLTREELMDLLASYRKKKRYHRLKNGDIVEFREEESLDFLAQIMDTMGVNVKDFTKGRLHIPAFRALFLNRMLEEHEEIASDRDRHFRALVKSFKTIRDSDYEVPETLATVMRQYQIYGYKWLRTLAQAGFGGILADDMGLGKTLQMISVMSGMKRDGEGGLSLVICPASLIYNWQEEFNRFAPELDAVPVAGAAAERKTYLSALSEHGEEKAPDVLITSYNLLVRDVDLYEKLHFSIQVLDEAQFIKNPQTAAAKAVKILHSEHRFALTGTPIENRLSELWSIFDYLMPGYLYKYRKFSTDFETPITKNKEEEVTRRLKAMVAPFILRRLKADVLKDLPDKLEEIRYARFSETQQKLYDAQVVHMQSVYADAGEGEKIRVLAELTKIREICCDPSLIVEHYNGESAKREACLDLVKSAIDGGHRVLLFSQFTSMLALLEADLAAEGIEYYKITGSTTKEERLRLVHAYNSGTTPVFLISLKAGGTGLNLTGADVVIHYDPWWNLAAQNQATDRAHRIGQTKIVTVYKLIAKGTIEEKIVKLQETKQSLSDAVVAAGGDSLQALTTEELLALLG